MDTWLHACLSAGTERIFWNSGEAHSSCTLSAYLSLSLSIINAFTVSNKIIGMVIRLDLQRRTRNID